MITTTKLIEDLNTLLNAPAIKDYCPNGLQVAGNAQIKSIVTGVTACQALINAAIERQADAILVHHGYFWKGETPNITGMKGERICALIKNNINLIAYHLPLDLHLEYGNNALLGKSLNIEDQTPTSDSLLRIGQVPKQSINAFISTVTKVLSRTPLHLSGGAKDICKVAWCTGAAQDMIFDAKAMGADVFISGEVSERTTHEAQELGIHYLACGHHATETFGVKALGEYIAQQYGVTVSFIDIANPV